MKNKKELKTIYLEDINIKDIPLDNRNFYTEDEYLELKGEAYTGELGNWSTLHTHVFIENDKYEYFRSIHNKVKEIGILKGALEVKSKSSKRWWYAGMIFGSINIIFSVIYSHNLFYG